MTSALRLVLLLDPLTARLRGGEHAAELARALAARGHSVRLYGSCFKASLEAGAGGGRTPTDREDSSARRRSSETLPERRSHDRSLREGRKHLLGYRPDAVLAYDALSPTAYLGARIARRLRVPLILLEHGHRADGSWFTRSLAGIGETLWGRYVRRTASALIALDPVARDLALKEGFPGQRIHLHPHGVDVERFRPGLTSPLIARHGIHGRILLCSTPCSAREGARSGLELVLTAFACTVGQRGDWSLVIAGDSQGFARLRAMADRLGVAARVHLLPQPDPNELPPLLSSATLAVLPGLEDEPRGAQLAHLLACGLPVLASNHPRTRFLIETHACGLLARAGDPEAWVEALQRAAGAPEARKRWGRAARRVAEELLAWTAVAAAVEARITSARAALDDSAGIAEQHSDPAAQSPQT